MRQISASKFKQQCLSLLDDLGVEGIVITKRGKPVAKVIPIGSGCAALIGRMKGKVNYPTRDANDCTAERPLFHNPAAAPGQQRSTGFGVGSTAGPF
jgi:antitoxin (DNA-binding transcriptional repressor) of toxin-antitoxin stability system